MTETQVWTIGRLLEWTTDYLRKSGSDSPRLDAEVLLAHARNCKRIQLYTAFSEEPDDATKAAFKGMVKRRAEGMPVAYLVGYKEFYSLEFLVSPDVLIPRGETEHLVIEALDRAKLLVASNLQRPIKIADLCTGSGCVAITLAKNLPGAEIVACDISPAALSMAKRNAEKHEVQNRIQFFQSDLFESGFEGHRFDIVVSNPPYVSESEFLTLGKSVRDFEPKIALVAGEDGLSVIRRIINEAVAYIADDGWLLLELSPMNAPALEQWVGQQAEWKYERTIKDLAGHQRVAVLRRA